MWRKWKKRVSDFFYEEIEDEELHEQKQKEQTNHEQQMQTSMIYQYPKKDEAPFRFPLIPDEQERLIKENKVINKTENNIRYRSRKRKNHAKKQDSYRNKYEKKLNEKELEDVPAYMRRKREMIHPAEAEKIIANKIWNEKTNKPVKENEVDFINYSKPDELDEVFRRRDRLNQVSAEKQAHIQITDPHTERKELAEAYERDIHYFKNMIDIIDNRDSDFQKCEQYTAQNEQSVHLEDQMTSMQEIIMQGEKGKYTDSESNWQSSKPHPDINPHSHPTSDHVSNRFGPELEEFNWQDDQISQQTNEEAEMIDTIESHMPNHLLNDLNTDKQDDNDWLGEQQRLLRETLKHFKIDASIVAVTQGPSVTRIEIQPALGVKVSKIRNLADDIKLNLAAKDIRIEAPIPGKNTIGIEIPNLFPQVVQLQEMIDSDTFKQASSPLSIALGLTIEGDPFITNIEKMPHGLIAGATGSGKSVCINAIILSLLYKAHYDDVKFILIDPKMVELTPYNGIPHLIAPVITDVKAATLALKWAVDEMEKRYEQFVEMGVRNITKYNEKMIKTKQEKLPYIVIIIDELADLMIISPQDVEDAICRIAQKARAAGIHLILATQRPSVDVITGLIKANVPTRIAFSVSSQVDSRTILDTNGAEKLLGKGDMLFIENGTNKSLRLQGPFVSDEEIDRVVHHLRKIAKPNYLFEQEELLVELENENEDELLYDAISLVVSQKQASTSLLQRRFRIGYNRAARLIDSLHQRGIISDQNGSKPREVLLSKSQWEESQETWK